MGAGLSRLACPINRVDGPAGDLKGAGPVKGPEIADVSLFVNHSRWISTHGVSIIDTPRWHSKCPSRENLWCLRIGGICPVTTCFLGALNGKHIGFPPPENGAGGQCCQNDIEDEKSLCPIPFGGLQDFLCQDLKDKSLESTS